VGAARGRSGPFFRLPGRGGHLGGPATKWGGRGRPAGRGPRGGATGGAALTFAPGRAAGAVFSRGVPSDICGWIEPAGSAGLGPTKFKMGGEHWACELTS
jgi:hypothetical protein